MAELVYLASADPAELHDESGEYIPIPKLPPHVRAAIASLKHYKKTGGITEIKLWPAEKALAMLRRLKCFGAS